MHPFRAGATRTRTSRLYISLLSDTSGQCVTPELLLLFLEDRQTPITSLRLLSIKSLSGLTSSGSTRQASLTNFQYADGGTHQGFVRLMIGSLNSIDKGFIHV